MNAVQMVASQGDARNEVDRLALADAYEEEGSVWIADYVRNYTCCPYCRAALWAGSGFWPDPEHAPAWRNLRHEHWASCEAMATRGFALPY